MCGPGTISERTSANRERQDDIKLLKAKHAYDLAKTENDRCRAAQNARQRVQVTLCAVVRTARVSSSGSNFWSC